MSIRVKDQMLSPQFKEIEQELSTQECRKFSTISAAEFNTPETKYRSTIGPNKMDLSKDTNQMHYRNGTAKFEDEQYKLCEEIKALFLKRQSLNPALFEPKILLKTENNPKRIIIKRNHVAQSESNIFDQVIIDKIYLANQQSLKNLFTYQF
ncbi:unnamed protein product (macronuclear) [Paramecium tetraurelia]|uniref:Uncharacterized protein n=1 Tax=Paramecium tetraurelia TaxID=5888 RepID=A0CPN4_PARTE|nr:uncharacterized protein GSPATT00009143001 [Paramecium tetraurelia]CAK72751.1 unnamed protein product [Paramecium tetraurelia]|eukprot:XP_001440148.1 hypothetical protein (macronuclear) [Paramecium tetraurelia strain d4-2]